MSGAGTALAKKRQEQARAELITQLSAQGLSEEEINQLSPFIDYYAENQVFPLVRNILAFLVLLTVVGLVFAGFVGIFLGVMTAVTALGAAVQYRHYSKANDLRRDLLAAPQQFLNGNHHYPEIDDRGGQQPPAQQPPGQQPQSNQYAQGGPRNRAPDPQRGQNEQRQQSPGQGSPPSDDRRNGTR